jgi:hypothetical protein
VKRASAIRCGGAFAATLLVGACAEDRILPVEARCGDGIVSAPEECDVVDGPGCDSCRIADGYRCADDACAPVCGDGQVVGDEQCDPPDGVLCDQSCQSASRTGCSVAGYYIARQTNYSRDTIVGQVQTSSNWYVYRFEQTGDAFEVKEVLHCGLFVTGSVTVSLDEGGYRGLLYASRQGPDFAQGPRRGTSSESGGSCDFSFERWYLVRGAEAGFLPEDFRKLPALSALAALPSDADPTEPPAEAPTGAIDDDGDGRPGFALRLTGNIPGVRNVVQRDWDAYATDADTPITAGAVEFSARADFDNEENVLAVSDCDPAACGFLVSGSTPARDLPGKVVFRYLGQDLNDPRVAALVQGAPGSDDDVDLETCARVRTAMPHETSAP